MSDQVKFVLDESRLPEAWYNIAADLPEPLPPVLHPGTGQPVGPDDLAPLFPMAIIGQEVSTDRLITIPGGGSLGLPTVAADASVPRAAPGEGARDTGAHLLQVRRRLADGLPQAEHRRRAGVLQQAGGGPAADDRDGRGPVGIVARVRRRDLRARGGRVDGQGLVRPEALPPRSHRGVRRSRGREPVRGDERRPRDPRGEPGLDAGASGSRSPRRSRRPLRATTRSTRSAPSSTTCSCTRP